MKDVPIEVARCLKLASLAPLLVLVTFGGGCGDGGPKYTSQVPSAFRERAVEVCNRALAQKKAEGAFPYPDFNPTRPDWARYPGVARALASTPRLFRSWLRDMESLGKPATGRAAWDDLVVAIRDHVRIAAEQYRAAVDHDTATFTRDYEEGSDVQDKLLDAATGAGVPECAAVDR
jgi:hypothetical protein